MAIKLITGLKTTSDIESQDDGARIYGTISNNDRVLNVGSRLACEIISNNMVRIKDGELLMQGRHVRQAPNSFTNLQISNGAQNMKRNDLIVARYTKSASTSLENVELAVVQGTPGATPIDPPITTGDIFAGCEVHEMALYRVSLDGLNIDSVTTLFTQLATLENHLQSISNGGTGATTASGAILNFKTEIRDLIYPVGSIYMSVNDTNPSVFWRGAWVAWGSGRMPVGVQTSDGDFNTVEKTGGEKTHTLTIGEVPQTTGQFVMHVTVRATSDASCSGAFKTNYVAPKFVNTLSLEASGASSVGIVGFDNGGGNGAHNNLQPYITCYMWKRIV